MNQPDNRQFTLRGMFILVTAVAGWLGLSVVLGPPGIAIGAVSVVVATIYFCRRSWAELAVVIVILIILAFFLVPAIH